MVTFTSAFGGCATSWSAGSARTPTDTVMVARTAAVGRSARALFESLLESALAAKAPAAAAPVVQWLKESRIEDKRLLDLAASLREVRK